MTVRFGGTNPKNDVLRTRAVIAEKKTENGRNLVTLDIDVLNQNDEATTPAKAAIAFS